MTPQQNSGTLGRIAELRSRLEELRPVIQEQFAKRPQLISVEMCEARALKTELDRLDNLQKAEAVVNTGKA